MYTIDIHSNKENIEIAKEELNEAIKLARKTKERVIAAIVGYGSISGKHRIKSNMLLHLDYLKEKKNIKDYIVGSDLDLFNPIYLNFKYQSLIPDSEKRSKNPGIIYIIL